MSVFITATAWAWCPGGQLIQNNEYQNVNVAPTAAADPTYVAVAWNKSSVEEVSHQQYDPARAPGQEWMATQHRLPREDADPPPDPLQSRQNRPMLEPLPAAMGLPFSIDNTVGGEERSHFVAIWDTLDQLRQDAGQATEINFGIW